jgi:hypothetical protein
MHDRSRNHPLAELADPAVPSAGASTLPGPDLEGKDPLATELGRRGGRKGGRARALSLTPEERREIARRAAAARWQRPGGEAGAEAGGEPARLPGTPVALGRGAIAIGSHRFDGFILEDGRTVLGLLSVEAVLGESVVPLLPEAEVVTLHLPGDWRLIRTLPIAAFVELCRTLVEQGTTRRAMDDANRGAALRALELLAGCAAEALELRIAAAVAPA